VVARCGRSVGLTRTRGQSFDVSRVNKLQAVTVRRVADAGSRVKLRAVSSCVHTRCRGAPWPSLVHPIGGMGDLVNPADPVWVIGLGSTRFLRTFALGVVWGSIVLIYRDMVIYCQSPIVAVVGATTLRGPARARGNQSKILTKPHTWQGEADPSATSRVPNPAS